MCVYLYVKRVYFIFLCHLYETSSKPPLDSCCEFNNTNLWRHTWNNASFHWLTDDIHYQHVHVHNPLREMSCNFYNWNSLLSVPVPTEINAKIIHCGITSLNPSILKQMKRFKNCRFCLQSAVIIDQMWWPSFVLILSMTWLNIIQSIEPVTLLTLFYYYF